MVSLLLLTLLLHFGGLLFDVAFARGQLGDHPGVGHLQTAQLGVNVSHLKDHRML